jgi:hypothetical protein
MATNPTPPHPDASGQIRIPGPPRIEVPGADRRDVVIGGGREQEQSIRDRKRQLFEDDDDDLPSGSRSGSAGTATAPLVARPFADYLRTTPPTPLSQGAKAALWTAGAIVLALFALALTRVG